MNVPVIQASSDRRRELTEFDPEIHKTVALKMGKNVASCWGSVDSLAEKESGKIIDGLYVCKTCTGVLDVVETHKCDFFEIFKNAVEKTFFEYIPLSSDSRHVADFGDLFLTRHYTRVSYGKLDMQSPETDFRKFLDFLRRRNKSRLGEVPLNVALTFLTRYLKFVNAGHIVDQALRVQQGGKKSEICFSYTLARILYLANLRRLERFHDFLDNPRAFQHDFVNGLKTIVNTVIVIYDANEEFLDRDEVYGFLKTLYDVTLHKLCREEKHVGRLHRQAVRTRHFAHIYSFIGGDQEETRKTFQEALVRSCDSLTEILLAESIQSPMYKTQCILFGILFCVLIPGRPSD